MLHTFLIICLWEVMYSVCKVDNPQSLPLYIYLLFSTRFHQFNWVMWNRNISLMLAKVAGRLIQRNCEEQVHVYSGERKLLYLGKGMLLVTISAWWLMLMKHRACSFPLKPCFTWPRVNFFAWKFGGMMLVQGEVSQQLGDYEARGRCSKYCTVYKSFQNGNMTASSS